MGRSAPLAEAPPATVGTALRIPAQVRPTSHLLLRTHVRFCHSAPRTHVRCQPICRTPVRSPCQPGYGGGVTDGSGPAEMGHQANRCLLWGHRPAILLEHER